MFKSLKFNNIKKYFPDSKSKWISLTKITIPVVLSSLFLSLNNFVDNFMVSKISGGITAVGLANVWTGIIFSFLISINAIGSIIFSQYWGKKDFVHARMTNNVRLILNFSLALLMAIFAWSMPAKMIYLVQSSNNGVEEIKNTIELAQKYLFVIAFSWILFAFTVTTSASLRESGSIKASMAFVFLTLILNVSLNLILIPYLGVVGSAIATVSARMVTSIGLYTYQFFYKKELRIVIWKIFDIKKIIWRQYLKRAWGLFFSLATGVSFSIRVIFWAQGMPAGSLGVDSTDHLYKYWGIGFLTVSGITSTIANILFVAYGSIESNISISVGRKLGQNRIDEAIKEAKMLKGYMFTFSLILSLFTLIVIFVLSNTELLVGGLKEQVQKGLQDYFKKEHLAIDNNLIKEQQELAVKYFLGQIFWVSLIIVVLNPFWIQLKTSMNIVAAGGRSNLTGIWNFALAIGQILWQAFNVFVLLPLIPDVGFKLIATSLIFYSSDIVRWIMFEILYLKTKWAINITTNDGDIQIA